MNVFLGILKIYMIVELFIVFYQKIQEVRFRKTNMMLSKIAIINLLEYK